MKLFNTRQSGLSLVELMVSLVISSVLILGISLLYVDNKGNYLFQQGQSDNNENARYTLLVLEEELRRVGYRIQPDMDRALVFRQQAVGNCSFQAGETINYTATARRLCIRYQPYIPNLTACDGQVQSAPPAPYQIDNSVQNVVVDIDYFGGQLRCNGQPIIGDIADFLLEFGVDAQDSRRETTAFTAAPAAGATITAVRYAALIRSRNQGLTDSTASPAFANWHETYYGTSDVKAPDKALYLISQSTITLRNIAR